MECKSLRWTYRQRIRHGAIDRQHLRQPRHLLHRVALFRQPRQETLGFAR
jgi:hypothetical protein